MSVAESTVIFGPMFQVGCASASEAVTPESSSRLRPRNGPPEAVRTSVCTVSGSRPSSSWKAAECSESTGRIRPSPFLHAVVASSPPATRLSLFASARSTPCSSAQNVAGSPAKPTTALSTTSGSGWAPMISSAWLPIDPVAPRSATRFIPKSLGLAQGEDGEIRRRRREEQRVDPIEDAAVTEQQPSGVLGPEVALHERLEEVAEGGRGDDHRAEGQRAPRVDEHGLLVEGDERREDACRGPDDEAFPRLSRRDDRRHLVPAGDPSSGVGECVRDEDGEEDRDERQPAVGAELAHEEQGSEAEADPRSAEDRRRDCDRRRLPRLRNRREDEAEDEREQEAGEHPVRAGDLRAAERRQSTAVAG